jgi:hypothetical protein
MFLTAPILLYLWPPTRSDRVFPTFILIVVLFFVAGAIAHPLKAYALLKLFPFQLAVSLPFLFLFVIVLAYAGTARPRGRFGKAVWVAGVVAALWMVDDEGAFTDAVQVPAIVASEAWISRAPSLYGGRDRTAANEGLYTWIRQNTPRDAVFVTPYLAEFWTYAERAQVVSFRHAPLDRNLLQWRERLQAINGGRPFAKRGFDITDELDQNEGRLTVPQLVELRERYGATHYLAKRNRVELADHLLYSNRRMFLYALDGLGRKGEE